MIYHICVVIVSLLPLGKPHPKPPKNYEKLPQRTTRIHPYGQPHHRSLGFLLHNPPMTKIITISVNNRRDWYYAHTTLKGRCIGSYATDRHSAFLSVLSQVYLERLIVSNIPF